MRNYTFSDTLVASIVFAVCLTAKGRAYRARALVDFDGSFPFFLALALAGL